MVRRHSGQALAKMAGAHQWAKVSLLVVVLELGVACGGVVA